MSTILVTGGAGYIGSNVARQLVEAGHCVVVVDNLSSGYRENLQFSHQFVKLDLGDIQAVEYTFSKHKFDIVMHFAASLIVPESVTNPLLYFHNNVVNTLRLVEICIRHGVDKFILSSTAAIYGTPLEGIAREEDPACPVNPYGQSKLMSEIILQEASRAHGMRYVILRYFNVAGADPLMRMGQRNRNATHLIKLACQTALGFHPYMNIYGVDYDTRDGTCIRDYIHVEDLASAHLAALTYLNSNLSSAILNVGYGVGYSVRQVLEIIQRVSEKIIPTVEVERRPGDPPILISNCRKINEILNWVPRYSNLEEIVDTSWRFEKSLYA